MSVKNEIERSGIFIQEKIEVSIEDHSQEYDNQAIKKSLLNIGLEPLLEAYEKRAIEILSEMGYPLSLDELWPLEPNETPSRVQDIKTFLSRALSVREHVRQGNASDAAWNAFLAAQASMRAEIRPYEDDLIREVAIMQPGRSLGGINRAQELRKEVIGPRNELWTDRADELRRKNPGMTEQGIASIILKETLKSGQIYSLRTVQRAIKK